MTDGMPRRVPPPVPVATTAALVVLGLVCVFIFIKSFRVRLLGGVPFAVDGVLIVGLTVDWCLHFCCPPVVWLPGLAASLSAVPRYPAHGYLLHGVPVRHQLAP